MDILFKTGKLRKLCNNSRKLQKEFGQEIARKILTRLDELRAANTLEVMRSIPQARCHELKANRAGQLSVDLKHPYRLIFEPANDPIPEKDDGGLDWSNVTGIVILGVEDTHA